MCVCVCVCVCYFGACCLRKGVNGLKFRYGTWHRCEGLAWVEWQLISSQSSIFCANIFLSTVMRLSVNQPRKQHHGI